MRIKTTTVLQDFAGNPLEMTGQTGAVTVGAIMISCLLGVPPQGTLYSPDEQVQRYQLALTVHKADKGDGEIDISVEMASKLKMDVARVFAPIVAGQVLPLLDGR